MVANRLTTINMSLAGPRNAILDRLIQAASARGIQVIAAAGNGGPAAPPAYPAAPPHVTGWLSRCRMSGREAEQCRKDLRRAARSLGPADYDPPYGYGLID
jgi:hypothetical protein